MDQRLKQQYKAAKAELENENYSEALSLFLPVLTELPGESSLWFNVGTCYLELEDEDRAREAYERAHRLDPEDPAAIFNLGTLSDDPAESADYYQQAIELGYADAHYNLALLHVDAEETDLAIEHLHQLIELEPDNKAAQYLLAAMQGDAVSTAPSCFVADLFDQYADHFDSHLVGELKYQTPQKIAAQIHSLVANDHHVLDLGCGTGLMAENLQQHTKHFVGVDLSTKMLEVAGEKNIYSDLHCADVLGYLQDDQRKYDWIIAADVFVYIGDLHAIFKEAARCLNPGGHFCYSVEQCVGVEYRLQTNCRFAHSSDYLDRIIRESGFKLINREPSILREQEGVGVKGFIDQLRKV